jgi:hypothetical protein
MLPRSGQMQLNRRRQLELSSHMLSRKLRLRNIAPGTYPLGGGDIQQT